MHLHKTMYHWPASYFRHVHCTLVVASANTELWRLSRLVLHKKQSAWWSFWIVVVYMYVVVVAVVCIHPHERLRVPMYIFAHHWTNVPMPRISSSSQNVTRVWSSNIDTMTVNDTCGAVSYQNNAHCAEQVSKPKPVVIAALREQTIIFVTVCAWAAPIDKSNILRD